MLESKDRIPLIFILGFTVLHYLYSFQFEFFWDTIQLGAKQAHYFYEHGFSSLILPNDIDSGHPPSFGMYLALVWKLAAKNLAWSHVAMLPFLFGILWEAYKIGSRIFKSSKAWLFPLFLILNPCFLGHSVLISPDLILIYFFLLFIRGHWSGQKLIKTIALIGLSIISLRGIWMVASFVVLIMVEQRKSDWETRLKAFYAFIPACLIILCFLGFHFMQAGWIGFHQDSPWAESFNYAKATGVLKNFAILSWKIIDFGNIASICFLMVLGLTQWKKFSSDNQLKKLILVFFILFVSFALPLCLYAHLLNPRYILPLQILIGFGVAQALSSYVLKKNFLWAAALTGLVLFSGNFWVYPNTISQGWDVSLVHTPYYDLKKEMTEYLTLNGINHGEVGTEFPLRSKIKYYNPALVEETSFKRAELSSDKYVLHSNVINDFKEDDLAYLNLNFNRLHHVAKRGVFISLYQRK